MSVNIVIGGNGGNAGGAVQACLEAQAAIDSIKGETVKVLLIRQQVERLLALGYITSEGELLVSWDQINRVLHPGDYA